MNQKPLRLDQLPTKGRRKQPKQHEMTDGAVHPTKSTSCRMNNHFSCIGRFKRLIAMVESDEGLEASPPYYETAYCQCACQHPHRQGGLLVPELRVN